MKYSKIAILLAQAEAIANQEHDGHLTIAKFTNGWKVAFDTPDLRGGTASDQFWKLKSSRSLKKALKNLLAQRPGFFDF